LQKRKAMKVKLYQVDISYFCCGVLVQEDHLVIEAAPIMGWAVGKTWEQVIKWVEKKKGYRIITLVKEY
jgi:hypothetical protein